VIDDLTALVADSTSSAIAIDPNAKMSAFGNHSILQPRVEVKFIRVGLLRSRFATNTNEVTGNRRRQLGNVLSDGNGC
jgi:hypothetical protein